MIDEIPTDKLDILIKKIKIILDNSTNDKKYLFDICLVDNFIDDCVNKIMIDLKKY